MAATTSSQLWCALQWAQEHALNRLIDGYHTNYHYCTSTNLILLLYVQVVTSWLLWLVNYTAVDWMCNCCGDNIAIVDLFTVDSITTVDCNWTDYISSKANRSHWYCRLYWYYIAAMDCCNWYCYGDCTVILHCIICNYGLKMMMWIPLLLWIASRLYCYKGFCKCYCW